MGKARQNCPTKEIDEGNICGQRKSFVRLGFGYNSCRKARNYAFRWAEEVRDFLRG
jgi:hypothetical protein